MQNFLATLFALIVSVVVFLAFEFGALEKADAFFLAGAIGTVFFSFHLSKRDGMPLGEALAEIFTEPRTYPRKRAYFATIAVALVTGIVVMQSIATAII